MRKGEARKGSRRENQDLGKRGRLTSKGKWKKRRTGEERG